MTLTKTEEYVKATIYHVTLRLISGKRKGKQINSQSIERINVVDFDL